jgi:hypothetical protein
MASIGIPMVLTMVPVARGATAARKITSAARVVAAGLPMWRVVIGTVVAAPHKVDPWQVVVRVIE